MVMDNKTQYFYNGHLFVLQTSNYLAYDVDSVFHIVQHAVIMKISLTDLSSKSTTLLYKAMSEIVSENIYTIIAVRKLSSNFLTCLHVSGFSMIFHLTQEFVVGGGSASLRRNYQLRIQCFGSDMFLIFFVDKLIHHLV